MPLSPKALYDPQQMSLPVDQRIDFLAKSDPGEFGKLPRNQQLQVLRIADEKYRNRKQGQPKPVPQEESKESFVGGIKKDLALGFRGGISDAARTLSNVEGVIGWEGAAKKTAAFSEEVRPKPGESAGRDSLFSHLTQAAGAAPAALIEYAPAALSKRYAPVVAAGIGVASKLHEGPKAALKEGLKQGVMFGGGELASKLPTRTARATGTAIAMAAPTAVESKGDVSKTAEAAIMGGVFGATAKKPASKTGLTPQQAQQALKGGWDAFNALADKVVDGVRIAVAPQNRSYSAGKMSRIIRRWNADVRQSTDMADYALTEARKSIDSMPNPKIDPADPLAHPRVKFIHDIQRGDIAAMDHKVQPFARTMRKLLDDKIDEYVKETDHLLKPNPKTGQFERALFKDLADVRAGQSIGDAALEQFYLNYFPNLWKDPTKATEFARNFYAGRRPLGGPETFRHQRKHPDIADGIAAGLEPVSTNAVDLLMLKRREVDRSMMAVRVVKEAAEDGLLQFVRSGRFGPKGYAKIQGKEFRHFEVSPSGERTIAGTYWAPEPVARVLNNHLSPGLRGQESVGWAFRGVVNLNNIVNQAQLGLSAFHLGFTSADAMASRMSLAIEQAVQAGKSAYSGKGAEAAKYIGQSAKSLASVPAAPYTNWRKGALVRQEWRNPGSTGSPFAENIVQHVKEAGGGVSLDPIYRTRMYEKMVQAFREGSIATGIARSPFALTEKMASVIMDDVVPAQKLGVFADLAQFNLSKLPQGATKDQVRHVLGKAWDTVDDRMGLLIYDNTFWNRWVKDLAQATTRSVGWNFGSFRQLGGGMLDTAAALKNVATGKNWEFTSRMAYWPAMIGTTMLWGGFWNLVLAHEMPKDLKDWFFPRTGRLDEFGRPERMSSPTYWKDVVHWRLHPMEAAKGKIASSWLTMAHMLENEDFFHTQMWDDEASIPEKAGQAVTSVAKGLLVPFVITNIMRQHERKTPLLEQAVGFIGEMPAPSYIKKTAAEEKADEYARTNIRQHASTQKESEARHIVREIERRIRTNDSPQKYANEQLKAGSIIPQDINTALRRAGFKTPLSRTFEYLELKQAVAVYEAAGPAERAVIRPQLEKHLNSNYAKTVSRMNDRQKKAFAQKVIKLMEEPVTAPPPGR